MNNNENNDNSIQSQIHFDNIQNENGIDTLSTLSGYGYNATTINSIHDVNNFDYINSFDSQSNISPIISVTIKIQLMEMLF